MAKQRYIKDSFWTDTYVEKLSPDYKLVFLYLLTNPLSNISGVYEIRLKRIAFETGYDIEVVENILKVFEGGKKIIRQNDWIIIINHLKHQYLGSKTAEGVNRIIEETPDYIRKLFEKREFSTENSDTYDVYVLKEGYPIQGVSKVPYSKVKLSKVNNIYGEFKNVNLTDEEYGKLKERFGDNNTNLIIEELSTYMASKGKRYSSHYATLLNWGKRKVEDYQKNKRNVASIKK